MEEHHLVPVVEGEEEGRLGGACVVAGGSDCDDNDDGNNDELVGMEKVEGGGDASPCRPPDLEVVERI